MFKVLMTHPAPGIEGQALSRKRWLRMLVLVGLGAVVIMGFGLLTGCGSDSNPKGAVEGKNAPTAAKSGIMKPQAKTSLLLDGKVGLGEMALGKKQPDLRLMEAIPGSGITMEQLEAKMAADLAKLDPKTMEAIPGSGITMEQLEAKMAAAAQAKPAPRTMEAVPGSGITMEQAEAKMAADRAKPSPSVIEEKFPGPSQGKPH